MQGATTRCVFRDLRQRGYAGGYGGVAAYARRLRQAQGLPSWAPLPAPAPACRSRAGVPALDAASSNLVGAAARDETYRGRGTAARTIAGQQAEVTEAIELAQAFTQLVRQRQPESMISGCNAPLPVRWEAIQRFAAGLYEDYAAVKAGVTLPLEHGSDRKASIAPKMLKRGNVWPRAVISSAAALSVLQAVGRSLLQRRQAPARPCRSHSRLIAASQTEAVGVPSIVRIYGTYAA